VQETALGEAGMKILIVDDEAVARRALSRVVQTLPDVELREASSLEEARRELAAGDVDVALIDLRLERDSRNRDGLTLVAEVRKQTSAIPIVVSASHAMAEVRAAMRLGAYDYVLKDQLSEEMVVPILQELQSTRALEREVQRLRVKPGETSMGLIGSSPPMQRLRELIRRVAASDRPVLITGPTGSGKELVVRAIHAFGLDPSEPLLDLNCSAFPDALIESQLFGHERGAFTGADKRHDGFFTAVGAGTLFLDEIAEMPLDVQAKLLRVLETGTYRPIGSSNVLTLRGRIIAATHADLEARVAEGQFREDLYYRLNVLEVTTPSLDERRSDIPALVAHFASTQKRAIRFTPEAMEVLCLAPWPGNVRQLRNFVDRVAVFATESVVTPEILAHVTRRKRAREAVGTSLRDLARAVLALPEGVDKLQQVEQALIEETLRLVDGNQTAAARMLGVHRKAIARRLGRTSGDGEDDDEPEVSSAP
jgi:DNA-binding NtrC family response regulator